MSKTIQQHKQTIRQQMRLVRNSIKGIEAAQAAIALTHQLSQLPFYAKAKRVASFLSFDGELKTRPLIEQLVADKGHCYLPKIKPNKPNRLWFMPYDLQCPMAQNKYGISEVDLSLNHALAISKLDLILMPLVAFDHKGNRLGMGGGYYDASLAHLKHKTALNYQTATKIKRPLCIGIAYEQQRVAQLPKQQWDFALDGVLTPEQFYQF
jgi:5-formyltetrahydrofolate cyclo-ligase